jgi:hypothetical protein
VLVRLLLDDHDALVKVDPKHLVPERSRRVPLRCGRRVPPVVPTASPNADVASVLVQMWRRSWGADVARSSECKGGYARVEPVDPGFCELDECPGLAEPTAVVGVVARVRVLA